MSMKATIRYYDVDGKIITRVEAFVAPRGMGILGIYSDDDCHTPAHEVIFMGLPSFISVKWDDPITDKEFHEEMF